MNEYRPISAESQQNFHILPHFNSKTTEPIFTIFFTPSRAISGAINVTKCDKRTHTMLKYYDKAMCSNNIQHNMTE